MLEHSEGKKNNISTPIQIKIGQKCRKIAAGAQHSYAIAKDKVYLWGNKQVFSNNQESCKQNDQIMEISVQVDQISTGPHHTFAWNKEEVYCWGSNDYYQLGLEEQRNYACLKVQLFEQAFKQGRRLTNISCGEHHTLAVFKKKYQQSNNGLGEENAENAENEDNEEEVEQNQSEDQQNQIELFAWGQSESYQLTLNTVHIIPQPIMSSCNFKHLEHIYSKSDYNVALCNSKVYSWGCNLFSRLGTALPSSHEPKVRIPKHIPLPSKIVKIGIGTYHVVAVSAEGAAYSWGKGNQGQLGIDKLQTQSKPTKVICDEPVMDVVCGDSHTLVLLLDGRLKSCGSNTYKVLGHNSYDPLDKKKRCKKLQFVQNVQNIGKITMLACGNNHNLVLTQDGKIFGWGANQFYQVTPSSNVENQPVSQAIKHPRKSLQIIVDDRNDFINSDNFSSHQVSHLIKLTDWKRRYDQFLQNKRREEQVFMKELQQIMRGINRTE